jgi:hypothetical protein
LQRFYRRKLIQKGLGEARIAVARKLGIRLWIMLRDQIDQENEFCRRRRRRRGQMRQKNGAACAGMPDTGYGAKQSPAPSDLGYPPPSSYLEVCLHSCRTIMGIASSVRCRPTQCGSGFGGRAVGPTIGL